MIYTNTSHLERQRVLSGEYHKGVKSPMRVIRLSVSPTQHLCSSPKKINKVISKPYQYNQTIQQSSNKMVYYTHSPPKIINQQPVYLNTTTPTFTVSSPSKPMTLRQRLWAKHKHQSIQQYNIWDGHQSQVSILGQNLSKQTKISLSNYNHHKKNVSRKSIFETGKIDQFQKIRNQNQKNHLYEPEKRVIYYR